MRYHRRLLRFALIACIIILLCVPLQHKVQALAGQSSSARSFPIELDHIFIWVAKGAPEAKALEEIGLHAFAEATQHTGQGTASKVFIFENAYLELIWIEDEQAAAKNAARSGVDMSRRARWRQTGASPFGIGLHYLRGRTSLAPFPVIPYWSEWMRPDTTIEFSKAITIQSEPMYFIVPDYLAVSESALQDLLRARSASTQPQGLAVKRLTDVRITTVAKQLTPTAALLSRNGVVAIKRSKTAVMELTFDAGRQGKRHDLQASLPLVIKY
jgi:hypothetical protein